MMKGDHGTTKLLHALKWGAFDNASLTMHASHAPQVRACNYYLSKFNSINYIIIVQYYTMSLQDISFLEAA